MAEAGRKGALGRWRIPRTCAGGRKRIRVCHLIGLQALVYANHNTRDCHVSFNAALNAILDNEHGKMDVMTEDYDDGQGGLCGQEEPKGVAGRDKRS